jgi:hypothetical protein
MTYIDEIAQAVRARVDPAIVPKRDVERLFRIYAVLVLAKGVEVTAEDVHDAWAAWECDRKPDSPSIVPFGHLTPRVQAMDAPFVEAIRQVARERSGVGA